MPRVEYLEVYLKQIKFPNIFNIHFIFVTFGDLIPPRPGKFLLGHHSSFWIL